ncbi:MAG: terpene cyclase/mutase family protein [Lacipirellulaceae bacterium]
MLCISQPRRLVFGAIVLALLSQFAFAQEATLSTPDADVLTESEWSEVDESVNRALKWLASERNDDGSFPTRVQGQPAVTSLCVMAFLSSGHSLNDGEYSSELSEAVNFTLDCQQANGLISLPKTQPRTVRHNGSHTAYYNHGISGLMLGEAYGSTSGRQSERIRNAIPQAIQLLQKTQRDKRRKEDHGGWQYYTNHLDVDSDVSSTTWQLMFLRSAKNAGFEMPDDLVLEATNYIERCYDKRQRVFTYGTFGRERYVTVGSVGGGIISLAMSGKHESPMALASGKWLMNRRFENYNAFISPGGFYHYGVYYSSHASYQLGGEYWQNIYPRIVRVLLTNQSADGSWPPETGLASGYGSCYSTALSVLALTPPYQLLPIYQR